MFNLHTLVPIYFISYHRSLLKAMVILSPLLGMTWIIGIFAVNNETQVFAWIFAILNSLQVNDICVLCVHVLRSYVCIICIDIRTYVSILYINDKKLKF